MASVNSFDKQSFLPFRCDELILNNKRVTFVNKITALIHIWEIMSELHIFECSIDELVQILEWAKLHTLNIVLEAEWSQFCLDYQPYLETNIQRSQFQFSKVNTGFFLPCERLLNVIRNPWQHPVLLKILKKREMCTEEEIVCFFRIETAYLTSVRLMKLCNSRCEDMAINLAAAFIDSFYLSCEMNEILQATHAQVWFIFDMSISLLYKYGNRQKIFEMLSGLSLEQGLSLINRFINKKRTMRIWSVSRKIAIYASQIYISQMAFEFKEEAEHVFKELIKIYYTMCENNCGLTEFEISVRRISNITNRVGLYKLCEALHDIEDLSRKHFLIEMYIKVITTDINECEMFKHNNDTNQVALVTAELAEIFCKLSKLLDEHIIVARECALTAFSLKPTEDRLKSIEDFAVKSGIHVDPLPPWKCPLHPPVLKSDELMWICSNCGDWMTSPQLERPTENNIKLHQILRSEVLGIPQTLCDDLSVCISYSRYQILSWCQPWLELHRLCFMYLKDPVATKNFITELKYVDIDYSMFANIKKEPIDELAGIEKGFEKYLDLYKEISTVTNEEASKDLEESSSSSSTSTLKEFIIKLNPLHITADLFLSPTVVLERNNDIQQRVEKKKSNKSTTN